MNIRIGLATLAILLVGFSAAANAQNQKEEIQRILEEKMRFTPEEIKKIYEQTEIRRESDGTLLTGKEKFRAFAEMMRKEQGSAPQKFAKNNEITETDERLISGDFIPESEVHAAINPKDSNNIIVSPIRQRPQATIDALSCPIYYTKDFGKTWKKSFFNAVTLDPDAVTLGGGDPMFVFDANGKAYFSWIVLSGVDNLDSVVEAMYWATSTDGGVTWQQAKNNWIGKSKMSYSALQFGQVTDFFDKQWFACDRTNSPYRGTVYAGMYHVSPTDSRMGIRVKAPNAQNFTQTTVRVPGDYVFNQFASTDVDNSGNLHMTFFATSLNGVIGNFLFHTMSTDGGKTLQPPAIVSEIQTFRFSPAQQSERLIGVAPSRFYPCPQFAIDKSDGAFRGNLYATWTGNGVHSRFSTDLDIYFARSTDNGKTWSNPIVVNNDGKDNGKHQFYPSITVNPEGTVVMTWYDRRNEKFNAETDYYIAFSYDGGLTFAENSVVSSSPSNFNRIGSVNGNFGIGEYHQVLATKSFAIPVWSDGRTNDGDINIYTAFVPITSSPPKVERVTPVNDNLAVGEVYPSPAVNEILCEFTLADKSFVQFDISDVDGKTLVTERRDKAAGNFKESLSVASLPPGAYWLKISTSFGFAVRKFAVMK